MIIWLFPALHRLLRPTLSQRIDACSSWAAGRLWNSFTESFWTLSLFELIHILNNDKHTAGKRRTSRPPTDQDASFPVFKYAQTPAGVCCVFPEQSIEDCSVVKHRTEPKITGLWLHDSPSIFTPVKCGSKRKEGRNVSNEGFELRFPDFPPHGTFYLNHASTWVWIPRCLQVHLCCLIHRISIEPSRPNILFNRT